MHRPIKPNLLSSKFSRQGKTIRTLAFTTCKHIPCPLKDEIIRRNDVVKNN